MNKIKNKIAILLKGLIPCELKKLETLEHPEVLGQEEKYPSGKIVASGYVESKDSIVMDNALYILGFTGDPIFHTSRVREVESLDEDQITFRTMNSRYQLIFKQK